MCFGKWGRKKVSVWNFGVLRSPTYALGCDKMTRFQVYNYTFTLQVMTSGRVLTNSRHICKSLEMLCADMRREYYRGLQIARPRTFFLLCSPPLCYRIIFNWLITPSEFSHYNKLNKIIIMICNILSDINLQDLVLQAAHHWLQNSCGHWFEQLQVNLGWCWVRLRPLWGGFRLW